MTNMMNQLYNTRQVAGLYGVTRETVRVWSEEFHVYLSPLAKPGRNKPRLFTREDLGVLSLVAELKQENMGVEDIQAALNNGQRGAVPELAPDELETMLILQNADSEALQKSLVQLQQQYNQTLIQYQQALAQLREAQEIRDENIQLKADLRHAQDRAEDLAKRLENAEQRIQNLVDSQAVLREEVGKSYAKGVIDLLRKRGDLPEE